MEKSNDYEDRFGACRVTINRLVAEKKQTLMPRGKALLKNRQDHTIVDSKRVFIITLDQPANDLKYRLYRYPEAAKIESDCLTGAS